MAAFPWTAEWQPRRPALIKAADKSRTEAPESRAASSAATSEALVHAESPRQKGGRVIRSSAWRRLSNALTCAISCARAASSSCGESDSTNRRATKICGRKIPVTASRPEGASTLYTGRAMPSTCSLRAEPSQCRRRRPVAAAIRTKRTLIMLTTISPQAASPSSPGFRSSVVERGSKRTNAGRTNPTVIIAANSSGAMRSANSRLARLRAGKERFECRRSHQPGRLKKNPAHASRKSMASASATASARNMALLPAAQRAPFGFYQIVKPIQHLPIGLADCIHKAGENGAVAGGIMQGHSNEMLGNVLPVLVFSQCGGVAIGLARFAAVQQTFFVQAVERGHDGGVGQSAGQFGMQIAHTDLAARPYPLHQLGFKRAQLPQGRFMTAFLPANPPHHRTGIILQCGCGCRPCFRRQCC